MNDEHDGEHPGTPFLRLLFFFPASIVVENSGVVLTLMLWAKLFTILTISRDLSTHFHHKACDVAKSSLGSCFCRIEDRNHREAKVMVSPIFRQCRVTKMSNAQGELVIYK